MNAAVAYYVSHMLDDADHHVSDRPSRARRSRRRVLASMFLGLIGRA
jgi:hypothetical protein